MSLPQVSKTIVGRLRPNFLALCQPAVPNPLTVAIGAPPSANPACSNTADPGELEDAHYSFPSGHTSTVFVFSLWTATYCLWALNLRCGMWEMCGRSGGEGVLAVAEWPSKQSSAGLQGGGLIQRALALLAAHMPALLQAASPVDQQLSQDGPSSARDA